MISNVYMQKLLMGEITPVQAATALKQETKKILANYF